jgi:hypothetical protein
MRKERNIIEADMSRRTKRVARNVKLVVEFIITRSRTQFMKIRRSV